MIILGLAMILPGCNGTNSRASRRFIDEHVAKVKSVAKETNLAYWEAATTGEAKAYDRYGALELQKRQIYSSPEEYAFLKKMKEQGGLTDPVVAREIEVLYLSYLPNQMAPDLLQEITALGADVEKKFSTFRGTAGKRRLSGNDIEDILKTEKRTAVRRDAWLASKQVGAEVAPDLLRLVRLRNKAAQKLGFKNYHALSLAATEQDEQELDKIFNELYDLTNAPFFALKQELDDELALRFHVNVEELQPWHYQDPFFQESPMLQAVNLDKFYAGKEVKTLAAEFYKGIGLPAEAILAKSDLYERDGKNPHAFCTDIDREGDVRVLCNLSDSERWMETMLHELGHGVYSYYMDPALPYILRQEAHAFTTEAIANFFGRLSRNPWWMERMLGLTPAQRQELEQVSVQYARLKQLIFSRWAMVMYHFEKELYADPEQDLNALWWNLVEKYQGIKKPAGRNEPDWAAKIHFTIAPCYYHNYVLGELLASQLHAYMVKSVLPAAATGGVSYVGAVQAGTYLRDKIFAAGSLYSWNEMIKRATGEPLTAKYFVEQFVN
jgi:peptidyl-dipeptidase A